MLLMFDEYLLVIFSIAWEASIVIMEPSSLANADNVREYDKKKPIDSFQFDLALLGTRLARLIAGFK